MSEYFFAVGKLNFGLVFGPPAFKNPRHGTAQIPCLRKVFGIDKRIKCFFLQNLLFNSGFKSTYIWQTT